MKISQTTLSAALTLLLAPVWGQVLHADIVDEVIHHGTVARDYAFPSFLDETNSSTRAWNLGPTGTPEAMMNGVVLDGPENGFNNGLIVTRDPNASATPTPAGLNWLTNLDFGPPVTDIPQRNLITDSTFRSSGTGIANHTGSGNDPVEDYEYLGQVGGPTNDDGFSVNISAVPGQQYRVEILSTPFFLTHWKNFNVTVDGTLFAENLFVPGQAIHTDTDGILDTHFWNSTYEFVVVADSDGIDIEFSRGVTTNAPIPDVQSQDVSNFARFYEEASRPIVNAISITAILEEAGSLVTIPNDVVDATDGETSLREAIAFANSNPDVTEITFDPSVFGAAQTPQTISLQSSLPNITTPVTIAGTGANLLTIDAGDGIDNQFGTGDGFTILTIDDDDSNTSLDVQIFGITFTGGDGNFEDATRGGAIGNAESLTLTESQLIGNNARFGGGLQNSGTATVNGTTISGNRSSQNGGGIENIGTLTLKNSTVSENATAGDGGGLVNFGPTGGTATVDIANSTFTGNIAGLFSTAGIWNSNGSGLASLTVNNSILADSVLATDTTFAGDYNLFGFTTDTTGGANDITDVSDTMLGPLTDNGGSTMTHSLMAGSPALNAGDPIAVAGQSSVPEFDQRGMARVAFGRIDIGAFEMQILLGDVNHDGSVNLLDIDPFIELISSAVFQAEADVNQDGNVNLLDIDPFIDVLAGG